VSAFATPGKIRILESDIIIIIIIIIIMDEEVVATGASETSVPVCWSA
jgi:hypothetical protein